MISLLARIYTQTDYQTSYRSLPKLVPDGWSVSSINRTNNSRIDWFVSTDSVNLFWWLHTMWSHYKWIDSTDQGRRTLTQFTCANCRSKSSGNQKWKTVLFLWGVITAKIKFGILLCCLSMRFLMFSLVFFMLRIAFSVFSVMFAKTSLLFCCFCIRLFVSNYVCVVPYGAMRNLDAIIRVRMVLMRNLDAIIRVRMVLCETWMLLFMSVWCYAKPRCYYSCPYGVMRNLVFRIMFVLIRVFRELDRYCLARVIN